MASSSFDPLKAQPQLVDRLLRAHDSSAIRKQLRTWKSRAAATEILGMDGAQSEITIWDHGELADVRQLLAELGVEFGEGEAKDSDALPTHLLVSSGSSSVEALRQIKRATQSHHFLHLVIVDRASRSLTAVLEREGCDMLARAPIHPTVLRLLVQRALFSGENKRLVPRVAIGETIKLKAGLWSRSATLAELSVRGCGLITSRALEVGATVSLVLPATLSGDGVLRLEGAVVGVKAGLDAEGGSHSAAVVFRNLSRAKGVAVNRIMQRCAVGPTGQLADEPGTPIGVTGETPAEAAGSDATSVERRAASRGLYEQPVLARGSGMIYSLIGCDLSTRGMRVSHDDGLAIGARLRLAIYGNRGDDPVIVSADVVREHAVSGVGLEFGSLSEAAAQRLQAIVDSLPSVSDTGAPSGTVVTEVLESD